MHSNIRIIIERLKKEKKIDTLFKGLHGIEREGLRVDSNLNLSKKDHPKELGDKFTDDYITTDFAESQLEIITPAFETIDKSVNFLKQLHKKISRSLNNEYLWPFSMPSALPSDEEIIIAKFGSTPEALEKEVYRKGLALRSGKMSQMISGIHYNFSFSEELWEFFYKENSHKMTMQEFKNDRLLELKKSLTNWSWLIVYFTGASPVKDSSYKCSRIDSMKINNTTSIRMSRCGYRNTAPVNINYDSFDSYTKSIKIATETQHPEYTSLGIYDKGGEKQQMNDNILQIANEYYFPIRIKPKPGKGSFLDGLIDRGAEYLELRMIDVNPFHAEGVDTKALKIIHLIIVCCFLDLPEIGKPIQMDLSAIKKLEKIAIKGGTKLSDNDRLKVENLFLKLTEISEYFPQEYSDALTHYKESLSNTKLLPWAKIRKGTENKDFLSYGKELIEDNLNQLSQ